MDAHDLTLRLTGTGVPSGEIGLDTLSRIAASLQELATRVGRSVVGQHGPGRTIDAAAKVVGLRLTGLRAGSTVLAVSFGEEGVLPLDLGVETEIAGQFWDIVTSVQRGMRPDWVTQPIADSTLRLVDALTTTAERVDIARGDGVQASWQRARVSREPWQAQLTAAAETVVTVAGRLEKVDLKDRRFRIRDDVGTTIALDHVADAERVGPLVGQRTEARGVPSYGPDGRLRELTAVVITPASVPAAWVPGERVDLEAVLAGAPGPDPNGIEGLTDGEVDAFLTALNQ
ncbi:MAG: hypothetical protein ACYCU5_04405 [Actinomycetes bacterium]